jgi:hypothetical protein
LCVRRGERNTRDVSVDEAERGDGSNAESSTRRVGRAQGRDSGTMLAASAWREEPPVVDESVYTTWAKAGWHSWNNMSPELEFCSFAGDLARMVEPSLVIETGTGQGFLTRRLVASLGEEQRLTCFEADPTWRRALASLPFFQDPRCDLSTSDTPSRDEVAGAGLCILDSTFPLRRKELELWSQSAPARAVVLVHDAGNRHPDWTPHAELARLIEHLGIPGVFVKNPRGGFLGVKSSA